MLTFDEALHRYYWNGVWVPNVSAIIEPLSDLAAVPKRTLEMKRRIGTAVHKACELDDLDNLDEDSVHPLVLPYLTAWRAFKAALKPRFTFIEQRMYHPDGYAGTPDRGAWLSGEEWLLDLKTTYSINARCHGAQLAGYNRMPELAHIRRRAAVKLGKDGRYKLVPLESAQHDLDFRHCWEAFQKEAA